MLGTGWILGSCGGEARDHRTFVGLVHPAGQFVSTDMPFIWQPGSNIEFDLARDNELYG